MARPASIILVGMSVEKQSQAAAKEPSAAASSTSWFDKIAPGLALVLCGGGFLSTGSLIHDTNMMILGAVFGVAGICVAIARLVRK